MPVKRSNYRIVILHDRRDAEYRLLRDAIFLEASALSGGRAQIEVTHDASFSLNPPGMGDPATAFVFIGSVTGAASLALEEAGHRCRAHLVPTLPVLVGKSASVDSQIPPALRSLNAVKVESSVSGPNSYSSVALKILSLVGLGEIDRRIFLSYRQADASLLADQLRRELIDSGWDVFLDRFSVPPGEDFQRRLDTELADKAFVLLLETRSATNSVWVEHEIVFAQSRKLGLLSLRLPGTSDSELFPGLDPGYRISLPVASFRGSGPRTRLKLVDLRALIQELEERHTLAYNLRRESAMLECSEELRRAGYKVSVLAEWSLLGEKTGRREVVHVTARSPEPTDLRVVDRIRLANRVTSVPTRGWVIHPMEDVNDSRSSLMAWLSSRRPLDTSPVMTFYARLT